MLQHRPVLLDEVLETFSYLNKIESPCFVDGTFGGGGHSKEIYKKLLKSNLGLILAIDRDKEALERAKIEKSIPSTHIRFHQGRFEEFGGILTREDIKQVDGILLDLGYSSMQLDDPKRGFSFQSEGPLDMRLDKNQDLTANEIINRWSEKELLDIFFHLGEERFSRRITRAIISFREKSKIETTLQLADLVVKSVPVNRKHQKIHPATNIFRALRMAVNGEVDELSDSIKSMISSLSSRGRLAIITFHSIEDRIVKHTIKDLTKSCICPPEKMICDCHHQPAIKIITKKPIVPSKSEILENPRSRSAKLRIVEKIM